MDKALHTITIATKDYDVVREIRDCVNNLTQEQKKTIHMTIDSTLSQTFESDDKQLLKD